MTNPGLNSRLGVTSFPCSSMVFLTSNMAIVQAIVVKSMRIANSFSRPNTIKGGENAYSNGD